MKKSKWKKSFIYNLNEYSFRIEKEKKKFQAVSVTVWVCSKAVITENTLKEESTDKNCSNDNYSFICSLCRFWFDCFTFLLHFQFFYCVFFFLNPLVCSIVFQ